MFIVLYSEDEGVVSRHRCTMRGTNESFVVNLNGENARNRILKTIRPLTCKFSLCTLCSICENKIWCKRSILLLTYDV